MSTPILAAVVLVLGLRFNDPDPNVMSYRFQFSQDGITWVDYKTLPKQTVCAPRAIHGPKQSCELQYYCGLDSLPAGFWRAQANVQGAKAVTQTVWVNFPQVEIVCADKAGKPFPAGASVGQAWRYMPGKDSCP